jgi:hypothetical protein
LLLVQGGHRSRPSPLASCSCGNAGLACNRRATRFISALACRRAALPATEPGTTTPVNAEPGLQAWHALIGRWETEGVRVRGRVELGRDAGPSMSFARQCRCSPRPATKPSCFSVVDVAANGNVLDHCVASETTCGEPTGFRPRKSPAPRDALRQQQRRCESDARPNQETQQRPEPTVARQVDDP